jgi:hypothetical protein
MGNEELLAQINELKKNQELLQAALLNKEGTQISDRGVEGTRTKYDLEASSYPDYTERLAKEGRLQRFGFGENYRLFYEVNKSRYQRADGIWEQQPRFVYQLWGRRIDPDTGEFIVTTDAKSGLKVESLYGINRYIFHEDPDSFRDVAENEGLDFTTLDFDYILAEARYIQVRDWLLGCFYPEAARPSENRKEMVIGNKLVEVKEVAVEANTNVKFDFSNMKKL